MRTIHTLPGSIGFSEGSDRSGHAKAGFRKTVTRIVAAALVWLFNRLVEAHRRRRDIHDLQHMDDRILKDIGITRWQADAEAERLIRL